MIVASAFPTRILIVDDRPEVRNSLKDRVELSSERYLVQTAATGAEALAWLSRQEFDIVLCDLVLRGAMGGREVIRAIHDSHPDVRIVVFTGREIEDVKSEILKAGAFLYLSKPLNYDALVHTIDTINSIRRTEYLARCFRTLSEIAFGLQSSFDSSWLARCTVEGCCRLGFDRARLYTFDSEPKSLIGMAACGMREGLRFDRYEIPLEASPMIAAIFEKDRPQIWNREAIVNEFGAIATEPWISELELADISWIDCPLMVGNERVGTLSVDNRQRLDRLYTQEDLEIMGVMSGMAAQALNNANLYTKERLANASLRRVLTEAPDVVVTTDLHGVITFVSPSAEWVTGHIAAKMEGQRAAEFFTDENGTAGAGQRIARRLMEELRSKSTIPNRRVFLHDSEGLVRTLSLSASLLRDEAGVPIGTLGFLKDLETLEAKTRQYRDLLEGFGYGILMLDGRRGVICFSNHKAAQLMGRSRDMVQGRVFAEMVPKQQRKEFERALQAVLERGTEETLEVVLDAPDGAPTPIKTHLTPVKTGRSVTGVAVALYGRREFSALIQSGNLMALGQMVAGVAHEINNPLNHILPTARDLEATLRRSQGPLTPRIEDYLRIIQKNSERIESIVRHLRDFARPREFRRIPVQLNDVVHDSLEFFATSFRDKNIFLDLHLDPALPEVSADPTRLWQVLVNFLMNAEEAMEGQAEPMVIQIESRCEEPGTVVVEVRDTGPGIPEEMLSAVFDFFFTTKSAGRGTGLGLAISRSIIEEMHGGQIGAKNTVDGRGACFSFRLAQMEPIGKEG